MSDHRNFVYDEHGPWNGRRGMAVRTDRRRPVQGPARIARYELLVEEGIDVFSRHDRGGQFLDASPAAAEVLGRAPAELIGRRWHDLVHCDDRSRFDGWWHNLHGGSGTILSFRIHQPDGSVARVETAARAGVLLDDQVFEVQAITRAAPSALDSTESLVRRCHEAEQRTLHLDRVNRDLARFAADTAHDLRSPLQVIAGFVQLMVRRDAHRLEEDSQRGLAIIMAAVNDMAEMIDSALAQGSPEVGQRGPGPVDCAEAARRAIQRVKTQIDAVGAVIEVGDLPVVNGEPTQLGRVFQNLLSNAVKAAAPSRTLRVDISARRVTDGWEISVTDNGIGVAPEDRQRIFEMFTHAWGDDRTEGSGIGLAICQSIVERHGGRIWVEAPPEGGSRFSFVLPG